MPDLTSAQKTTLKNHIDANTTVITVGGNDVQIKDVLNTTDTNGDVAVWYNSFTVGYLVWRSSVSRSEVYHSISSAGTVFDWNTFKSQSVTEQNAWVQMFMGDNAPFNNLSFRNGVFSIFSGSAPQNSQRAHIFATGRRLARRIEQILATAPTSAGGITVGVNNGNTTGDAAGGTTNPFIMGFEGQLTAVQITDARTNG